MMLAAFGLGASNSPEADAIPPLRPPRGEIPLTFWEQYGAWMIAGSIFFLFLFAAVIWRFTRPRPKTPIPVEVQARETFESLRDKPEDGFVLSRISRELRHYIGAAFGLPPVELTTSEFSRAVATNEKVGPQLSVELSEFLKRCDERKFALTAPKPAVGAATEALTLLNHAEARRAEVRRAEQHQQNNSPQSAASA
ncbi:MAG TPA: hypothetical protein VLT36_11955 [Candidatus Dormibacteraeota bacterium]|nr:hypothetical protein [Candidatus Dormibacteraeota bacterium]